MQAKEGMWIAPQLADPAVRDYPLGPVRQIGIIDATAPGCRIEIVHAGTPGIRERGVLRAGDVSVAVDIDNLRAQRLQVLDREELGGEPAQVGCAQKALQDLPAAVEVAETGFLRASQDIMKMV